MRESEWFSLKIVPRDLVHRALTISIPRKTVPLATERNRMKRLIREAYRRVPELHGASRCHVRVVARPARPSLENVLFLLKCHATQG